MADLYTTVSATVDGLIAGKTLATNGPLFSTQNHATATYVRNVDSWLAGIDTTCISPWNSAGGNHYAGVLISRRHAAIAWHWPNSLPSGTVFRFIASDGTVRTATTTGVGQRVGPVTIDVASDIQIVTFDADVHASITPAKIAPSNLRTLLQWNAVSDFFSQRMPLVALLGGGYLGGSHPNKIATIKDLAYIGDYVQLAVPSDSQRLAFHVEPIGGDSGNPIFLIVGGELVLLTHYFAGWGGPHYAGRIEDINAITGATYQPAIKDLSAFDVIADPEQAEPDPEDEPAVSEAEPNPAPAIAPDYYSFIQRGGSIGIIRRASA